MSMRRWDNDAAEDSATHLADLDRAAWHDADRHDRTAYVRVGGMLMDADRVPDRVDCEE
jgi:hypothetical protein